ncbi:YCF48-related protein [Variovorax sp. J22R133]|uniref:WD40/YVTN/BNR-like repeat-containing protein n=1 Tax=Variovorax brevis TaxID=3053503 RepID=UPI0025789AA3|nr:YCF48-related protein [Variovorax sp. J22R133]MDM0111435.1 YCF48-related protein [Variovorax sp. J22R133]
MKKSLFLNCRRLALTCVAGASMASAWAQAPADAVRYAPAVVVPHAVQAQMLSVARAGGGFVAVGDHGVVLRSADAGKTWQQAATVPVDAQLNSVSFVSDKEGWAAGHGGTVLHTADGGATWSLQRSATTEDRPLFAIHFFDAQHGVAVGLWSLVLVTEDGGKTWTQQTVAPPPGSKKADLNLLALFADAQGRLYATAEKGMVLVSDNRGRDWRYLETGYAGSFWTGTALPDGGLLVGGLRGSLYRSADHGATWQRVETNSKSSITSLAAQGTHVLAAGLDGLVLHSKDSGKSFQPDLRADRASLTAALLTADGRAVLMSRQGPVADTAAR